MSHKTRNRTTAPWWVRPVAAGLCAIGLAVAPCLGEDTADELDPGTLIDALAQEGMGELLLHLVETERPDDPVLARQVEIAGLRIEYQRLLAQASGAARSDPRLAEVRREQAAEAYGRLVEATRGLIRDHDDHDQRPIWQTDLAQSLILDYLHGLNQSAPLFADFGVTTPEQQSALEQAAPQAYEMLVDAQLRLFNLRGEVGRDPARSQRLQSSGLFYRLFDEYDQRRTPYLLAYAAYLVARLPDSAPYFAEPDGPEAVAIPQRELDAERERRRLLELADAELKRLADRVTDGLGIRDAATVLHARVRLARGRYDEAIESLEELIQGEQRGFVWLNARLTRAAVLDRRGAPEQALEELDALRRDPAVTADLRYSLLATDLTHRVLLAEARRQPPVRRDDEVAQSYQPYLDLLSGPITGAQAEGLRDFIYRRWEASVGADAGQAQALPAIVRLAISQVLRQQGQVILEQLDGAAPMDPGEDRIALRGQAKRKFDEAARLAQGLVGEAIDPEIRAEAMYNLALAMYGSDPDDPANRLKLTAILIDLAEAMPGEPVAEDAITAAVALLRELHQVLPTPVGVERAYERAVGVLFTKFPTSEAADGERLYYGYAVLAQSGRHREAVDMYKRVPFDHDDYFRARRQALISLLAHERDADPTAKPRLKRELDGMMQTISTEAGRIRNSQVNPDRAVTARRAEATVRLTRADLAMDEGDYDAVVEALEGFEQDYPQQPDLIALSLEHRIVALGDAGRHEALAEAARRMVRDFPDQAAPVIDQVLTQAERRIDVLNAGAVTADTARREVLQNEADERAQAAEVLSGILLDWANTQGYDARTLMPFEVIRAKTLRLAGENEAAHAILGRLVTEFPNDVQVMLEYAEVLYQKGGDDSLVEAVRYYDRLITGLTPPYPSAWWTAWMRRLQINDRLGEGTEDIPLRVRQLRMTHPDLGGPVSRTELGRLEQKHGR
jgi:tetratricopeptide (TPR) repeat protein